MMSPLLTLRSRALGEENLVMTKDPWYTEESILVHELGHSVMDLGCSPSDTKAIEVRAACAFAPQPPVQAVSGSKI